ncbi:MAG: restriction endonuclease subunit M [Euryarchaeota archaeon]|nr:restriction endonuclease subunit M [Euryarchaeota archaeon]
MVTGGRFLKQRNDVVLSWPFKDCILEGGQSKDEDKRQEVFFNEILAQDEITQLLEPKILTNAKTYSKKHGHDFEGFRRDAETNWKRGLPKDTINDNLIIKGNNLLTSHSIVKEFGGKTRLVYLDPPYNTKGAANTFSYNNSFNHSSWMTFMKNRIEVSKKLLKKDGVIAVAIDNEEVFYLGLILDEVFGRENRLGTVVVVHNPGGRQDDHFFPSAHEYLLIYAKDKSQAKVNTLGISGKKLQEYKEEDKFGKYKLRNFRRSGNNSKREDRENLFYPIYVDPKTRDLSLIEKKGFVKLLPIDPKGVERCWRWGQDTLLEKMEKYIAVKETKNGFDLYTKERESDYKGEKPKSFWNKPEYSGQAATNQLKKSFGEKVFSYPKSPYLMRDIINCLTDENDIVIDIFAGSGTTGVVAHKLNRQYILIEQMDYVEAIPVLRLLKAIEGDQADISEEVDWKGGGSFTYFELKKYNQTFSEQIEDAEDSETLLQIWERMKEKSFLNYNVDIQKQEEHIDEFKTFELTQQKRHLQGLLDQNQLYVNLSSINDKDFTISEGEKQLSNDFYRIGRD